MEHLFAIGGQYALGVELYATNIQLAMAQGHNLPLHPHHGPARRDPDGYLRKEVSDKIEDRACAVEPEPRSAALAGRRVDYIRTNQIY